MIACLLAGAHLLQRSPLTFSKRKHGQQIAMLAGAFAALKLYPPQLLGAVCEHIKVHKYIISLLGAQVGWSVPAVRLVV